LALCSAQLRSQGLLERSAEVLPADGTAMATLRLHARSWLGVSPWLLPKARLHVELSSGIELVRVNCSGRSASEQSCTVRAGVRAGTVEGRLVLTDAFGRSASAPFSLRLEPSQIDSDGDGFPDVVELTSEDDRLAFRRWFATVAEEQYYAVDARWGATNRDCAGLLRFAYVEALKPHDRTWRARQKYLPDATTPDVSKYHYPAVPLLGERLFRVMPGPFDASVPVEQAFSNSATARWLLSENAVFLGKERSAAGVGDLLFFSDPDAPGMGFHSMIYLADLDGVPGEDDWVVYHTGPEGSHHGEVRKVRLTQLLAHPEEKWHPQVDNPNFLGFYRWKIAQ
jgi:uncharacterized protein YfaT (DUF1175 family)